MSLDTSTSGKAGYAELPPSEDKGKAVVRVGYSLVDGRNDVLAMYDAYTERDSNGRTIPKTLDTVAKYAEGVADLIDDNYNVILKDGQDSLKDLLEVMCGTYDEYDSEALALGSLNPIEYLVLPAGFPTPTINAIDVGDKSILKEFCSGYASAVYVLNKGAYTGTNDEERIKFATLRMEAVMKGWYDGQAEVKFAAVPSDYLSTAMADDVIVAKYLQVASDAAFFVPLASEHAFRTLGHQYLKGGDGNYAVKCVKLLKAMLAPQCATYLPHGYLFHSALHWIGPKRIWEVIWAQRTHKRIPDAIKIRIDSGPAGAALVTTSAAILKNMQNKDFYHSIDVLKFANTKIILEVDSAIRADPPRYHRFATVYGADPLDEAEMSELAKAKLEAERLAPVTQPFAEVMLAKTGMSKQKVLNKHVNNNPVLAGMCKRLFQQMKRQKAIDEKASGSRKRKGGPA